MSIDINISTTTATTNSSINSDDDDDDGNDGNDYNNLFHHPKERIQIPSSDGSCCGHSFCRECLHNHCSYAVSIHKLPVRCPSTSVSLSNNNKNNNNDNICACSTILPVNLIRDSLLLYDRIEQQRRRLPIQEQESDDNDNDHDNDNDDDHENDDLWKLNNNNNNNINSNNKDWVKFQRLHRMYLDPSLISCTRCDELLVTSPTTDASNSNDYHQKILCQNCQSSKSKSEDDEEKKQNQVVNDTAAALLYNDKRCKPCSHCYVPIYKESGCDHIICTQCHQDMCFKCGTHLYLNGNENNNNEHNEHTSTTMIRNCSNCSQSYIDHRHLNKYRIFLCIFLPFYIPFYLMYILFACILVIITVGCFCCLCCGIRRYSSKGKKEMKKKVVNYSTTGSSSTKTSQKRTTVVKYKWMPLSGIQKVFGFIFLPFLNLFRQCGFTCCCTSTSFSSLFIFNYDVDENNDDDDDEIIYYDDDEYDGNDYLEEIQGIEIRLSSATSTSTARTDRTLLIENV